MGFLKNISNNIDKKTKYNKEEFEKQINEKVNFFNDYDEKDLLELLDSKIDNMKKKGKITSDAEISAIARVLVEKYNHKESELNYKIQNKLVMDDLNKILDNSIRFK